MTPNSIIRDYERGAFTATSAVLRLCDVVEVHDPAAFAGSLPKELMTELRERSSIIPKPEEFLILHSECRSGPFDEEQRKVEQQAEKERYVAGLRTWKAYFESLE